MNATYPPYEIPQLHTVCCNERLSSCRHCYTIATASLLPCAHLNWNFDFIVHLQRSTITTAGKPNIRTMWQTSDNFLWIAFRVLSINCRLFCQQLPKDFSNTRCKMLIGNLLGKLENLILLQQIFSYLHVIYCSCKVVCLLPRTFLMAISFVAAVGEPDPPVNDGKQIFKQQNRNLFDFCSFNSMPTPCIFSRKRNCYLLSRSNWILYVCMRSERERERQRRMKVETKSSWFSNESWTMIQKLIHHFVQSFFNFLKFASKVKKHL